MKIQNPKPKIFFVSLIIGACLIISTIFYLKYPKRDQNPETETEQTYTVTLTKEEYEKRRRTISLDMNGNGEKETVIIHPETEIEDGYLSVYNTKGEKIARSSKKSGTPPIPFSMKAYKLKANDPKEFLAMEYIAGLHQFQTTFMVLDGDSIYSIPKTKNPKGAEDYFFYITQDSLIVADIDGDGFSEVCEIASVYPSSEELNDEEKRAIDEVFEEEVEDAKEIVENEQGQRVAVIWGIYSFNGKYFEPQTGEAYDRLFSSLTKDSPFSPMKKSEMSQSDIEYTERTRNFWTHR